MYKYLKFCFKIYHYIQIFLLRIVSKLLSKDFNPSQFNKVLIISPHPDDEVFGCGGLIQSLIQEGKHVELIILSKGEAVHRHCCPNDEDNIVQTRSNLAIKANALLGIPSNQIHHLDFPDGNFISTQDNLDLIDILKARISNIAPTEIFIPHPYENSPDHAAATRIILNTIRDSSISVFYYCVWTWYHMPLYKIPMLKYSSAYLFRIRNQEIKNKAIDTYINNRAKCGVSFSGDLPKPFIFAFRWKYELFFRP